MLFSDPTLIFEKEFPSLNASATEEHGDDTIEENVCSRMCSWERYSTTSANEESEATGFTWETVNRIDGRMYWVCREISCPVNT